MTKVCVNMHKDARKFLYFLDCCSEMWTEFTHSMSWLSIQNLVLEVAMSCSLYIFIYLTKHGQIMRLCRIDLLLFRP